MARYSWHKSLAETIRDGVPMWAKRIRYISYVCEEHSWINSREEQKSYLAFLGLETRPVTAVKLMLEDALH